MNISPGGAKAASLFLLAVLTLLARVGIVVFAVMAAWRLKFKGVWILSAAAIIGLLQMTIDFLISSPFNMIDHDTAVKYRLVGSGYLSFAATITALVGWCVLAFSRKK